MSPILKIEVLLNCCSWNAQLHLTLFCNAYSKAALQMCFPLVREVS